MTIKKEGEGDSEGEKKEAEGTGATTPDDEPSADGVPSVVDVPSAM